MKKNLRKIMFIIGSLLLVSVIVWQLFAFTTSAQPLSESDAKNLVRDMYDEKSARIVDINLNKNIYQVTLEIENQIYEVMIDKHSGEVFGIFNNTPVVETNELNEEEIKDKIFAKYQGDLKEMARIEINDQIYYEAIIVDEHEQKNIKINAMTGNIDLLKTEKIEQSVQPPKKITEEEAIKIALKTVKGEVDDVDLDEVNGVSYYFIEIEQGDDSEATIQINAITGEVISTYWDD
jgi:uncharacterized membrane protein YkoI